MTEHYQPRVELDEHQNSHRTDRDTSDQAESATELHSAEDMIEERVLRYALTVLSLESNRISTESRADRVDIQRRQDAIWYRVEGLLEALAILAGQPMAIHDLESVKPVSEDWLQQLRDRLGYINEGGAPGR